MSGIIGHISDFSYICTPKPQILTDMHKISFSLFLLIPIIFSCSKTENADTLRKLDEALENKAVYENYFLEGTRLLKDVLSDQTDPELIYGINLRLADSYLKFSKDSSLAYMGRNRELALAMRDEEKLAKTDFAMAVLYAKTGYQVEANDILNIYRGREIPENAIRDYYAAEHTYWGETMAYAPTHGSYEEKLSMRNVFRGLLLPMTKEGSWEWYDLKREEADATGNGEGIKEYAFGMLKVSPENSREYAEAAYYYAHSFSDEDAVEREKWLLRSAIADVMCATRDYASLNEVSRIMFDKGDIDRAFRYAADHCMVDALCYNGKLRPWQILMFFPEIETAYQQKHARQSRYTKGLLICISALLVMMFFLLAFLYKRQQILDSMRAKLQESYLEIYSRNHELVAVNSRLVSLNAQMQESDKVKQEYITLFLGMVSDNINASRQYRNRVLKYIRQGKTKVLTDEIEAQAPLDEDIMEFYRMFDQTFVNLYPDFVDKFNSLLVEGAAIVPKGDDILTPELRIFALIKLGITESSRIASLLHYSANTIYNYRAKIKNKAKGSREDFEDAVRNLE